MRILLVEDDDMLGKATKEGLSHRFAVDWCQTLADTRHALRCFSYDLVVLDLNLPDGSGLDIIRELRRVDDLKPILILTARDAVRYRIEGLEAGGDDYLVKPFDLNELIARCTALLRRAGGQTGQSITVGDLIYDPVTRVVSFDNKTVQLSGKELAILDYLIKHRDQVVSKSQIEQSMYDWNHNIESNTVEVHISNLRRKTHKDIIRTIRGVGYVLPAKP